MDNERTEGQTDRTPVLRSRAQRLLPRSNIVLCASCICMVIVFAIFAVLTVFFPVVGWMLAFPMVFMFLIIMRHLTACVTGEGLRAPDRLTLDRNRRVDDSSSPHDLPPSYDDAMENQSSENSTNDSQGNGVQGTLGGYRNESFEPDSSEQEPPPPSYEEAIRLKEEQELELTRARTS